MLDDKTPHVALVVQAVIPDRPLSPQNWGDKGRLRGAGGEGEFQIAATTLSDENGKYQFINLKPGRYQVRCYTLNGYVYYGSPPLSLPAPQPPNFGGQVDEGDKEGGKECDSA